MSIGKIGEFNLSSGNWSTYIDRMEQYFLANDVKVNLQVPTLLACVGDATYELMVDLCSPKKPGDVKFSELVHLVKKHIQPAPSILAERYKFRRRVQEQNETVAQFSAALKHLARDCEFKDNLKENLRDQFVCGLSSETTRQRLFCEDDMTFASAFKRAVVLEAAAKGAAAVEQRITDGAVHAVHAQPHRRCSDAARAWARMSRRDEGSGTRSYVNGQAQMGSCFSCGGRNHIQADCRFQNYTCRVCLRPGHLQRVCPSVGRKAEGQVLRLDTTRLVEVAERRGDSCEKRENFSEEYDDEGVGGPSGLYMMQMTEFEPIMTEVIVANRRLVMHVDTGSPISCISDEMYAEMFSEYKLEDNNYKLKAYNGSDIKCVGYITVPVKYDVVSENLRLYVILKGALPLLGREWLKKLHSMSVIVPKSVSAREVNNKTSNSFHRNKFICTRKHPEVFSEQGQGRAGAGGSCRRASPPPLALCADDAVS